MTKYLFLLGRIVEFGVSCLSYNIKCIFFNLCFFIIFGFGLFYCFNCFRFFCKNIKREHNSNCREKRNDFLCVKTHKKDLFSKYNIYNNTADIIFKNIFCIINSSVYCFYLSNKYTKLIKKQYNHMFSLKMSLNKVFKDKYEIGVITEFYGCYSFMTAHNDIIYYITRLA